MKKENKPTHDKHEHAANMSWLRYWISVVQLLTQKQMNYHCQLMYQYLLFSLDFITGKYDAIHNTSETTKRRSD